MSDTGPPGPGWYYANGDPPGTQRYWDGTMWHGDPQPVAPAPGYATGFGQAYGEPSQASTALVLSILGLVCCGPLAAGGWYVGHHEVVAIDAGRRDPHNRGTANAGRIIGMIGTLIWVVLILGYMALIVAAV